MSFPLAPESRLVEYLLGRMPETERLELEARLLRDEDLDEELLATTDDLIQAYLAGALPEEDRSQFETHFLASPENREQLALTKDVLTAVQRVSDEGIQPEGAQRAAPVRRSRDRVLAAAAAVTVAAALATVVVTRRMDPGEKQATAGPRPRVSATPSAKTRTESPIPHPREPPAVRVIRLPGKSGSEVKVPLSPSTRTLRVEVPVDEDSLSFDAAILTADGTAVWRAEDLAPSASGQPLVFEVSARIFAPDRYTLRVEGESLRAAVAPVLEYHLQVVREP